MCCEGKALNQRWNTALSQLRWALHKHTHALRKGGGSSALTTDPGDNRSHMFQDLLHGFPATHTHTLKTCSMRAAELYAQASTSFLLSLFLYPLLLHCVTLTTCLFPLLCFHFAPCAHSSEATYNSSRLRSSERSTPAVWHVIPLLLPAYASGGGRHPEGNLLVWYATYSKTLNGYYADSYSIISDY